LQVVLWDAEAVAQAIADRLARDGEARAVTVDALDSAVLDDAACWSSVPQPAAWGLLQVKTRPTTP
jgi:hypothetical protein